MAYEYNLVIVGGGAAGLVSAVIGTAVKAKVALIEQSEMGGDCLNTGCVPSKALLKTAKVIQQIRNSKKYGIKQAEFKVDFQDVMDRVHNLIARIAPHDSVERFTSLGVDCFKGHAEIIDKHHVKVNDKILSTKNIILAHGAEPFVPELKGLSEVPYLTSENLWQLKKLPEKLLVLGGGPIGVEMSQAFQRIGAQVTLVEKNNRALIREDDDVAEEVIKALKNDGVKFFGNSIAREIQVEENGKKFLICDQADDEPIKIEFDEILFAIGRKARSIATDPSKLGIKLRENGTIAVDKYMRANGSNIFACGDITGPYQFTHMASHQAFYCAFNALFRPIKFAVDYSTVPKVTYSDPEIAQVGLTEKEAQKNGEKYDVFKYDIRDLDRAIVESEAHGIVKILTKSGTDKIIGAAITAHNAGESLAEITLAMKNKLGLNKILGTIHPYPTMVEANKYAAGIWRKSTSKNWLMNLLEKVMKFRR